MIKYFLYLLIFILTLLLGFILRPKNIETLEISGFEDQEKALRDKYSKNHHDGKGYTKEELESIKKEVNDLIKLKREKEKEEKNSS